MRIGIDARFWGIEHTGIGRYLMELVKNLEKIDQTNDYLIFLRKKYFRRLKFKNPRFKKVLADFPHYSFSEQILFKKLIEKENLDLVHFPHFNLPIFYRGKYLVTIHDLIKHESKGFLTTTRFQLFYWFKYLGYLITINLVLRRAQKILVPSHWWRKRLQKKFNLQKGKIRVTYEAVSQDFKKLAVKKDEKRIAEVLKKYEIKTPFVIYTGNLYPHKNLLKLAEAIGKINQQRELFLVIVCAKSVFWQRFRREINKLGVKDSIVLAGFVPDRDLVCLYRAAQAFIFPSLLEGFGLPGLEAMAAGLPVIASRASCLPEIYQEAAYFFDPKSPKDMAAKILDVLRDSKLRKDLVREGQKRLKDFSWQKMAKQTLLVYYPAASENSHSRVRAISAAPGRGRGRTAD
jgi:glycosyltransferase involved in cell wall biosynthesis